MTDPRGFALPEIPARWVIFDGDRKVGEGTTIAAPVVLNRMVESYAAEGQRFLWERVR